MNYIKDITPKWLKIVKISLRVKMKHNSLIEIVTHQLRLRNSNRKYMKMEIS